MNGTYTRRSDASKRVLGRGAKIMEDLVELIDIAFKRGQDPGS